MKERIVGSITVIILLSVVLILLLQGQGIERIEQYLGVKEDIQAKYDERKGWILKDVERKGNGEPEETDPKAD